MYVRFTIGQITSTCIHLHQCDSIRKLDTISRITDIRGNHPHIQSERVFPIQNCS